MLLYPNNSSSLKNYYLLDSRGDSGTFQVKSIVGTRDVRKNKSFREGGSMELTKRQEQLHFLLLFYSAGFCLYCSFRNRRVDSMQSVRSEEMLELASKEEYRIGRSNNKQPFLSSPSSSGNYKPFWPNYLSFLPSPPRERKTSMSILQTTKRQLCLKAFRSSLLNTVHRPGKAE